jgi:hypothetical protein
VQEPLLRHKSNMPVARLLATKLQLRISRVFDDYYHSLRDGCCCLNDERLPDFLIAISNGRYTPGANDTEALVAIRLAILRFSKESHSSAYTKLVNEFRCILQDVINGNLPIEVTNEVDFVAKSKTTEYNYVCTENEALNQKVRKLKAEIDNLTQEKSNLERILSEYHPSLTQESLDEYIEKLQADFFKEQFASLQSLQEKVTSKTNSVLELENECNELAKQLNQKLREMPRSSNQGNTP